MKNTKPDTRLVIYYDTYDVVGLLEKLKSVEIVMRGARVYVCMEIHESSVTGLLSVRL